MVFIIRLSILYNNLKTPLRNSKSYYIVHAIGEGSLAGIVERKICRQQPPGSSRCQCRLQSQRWGFSRLCSICCRQSCLLLQPTRAADIVPSLLSELLGQKDQQNCNSLYSLRHGWHADGIDRHATIRQFPGQFFASWKSAYVMDKA